MTFVLVKVVLGTVSFVEKKFCLFSVVTQLMTLFKKSYTSIIHCKFLSNYNLSRKKNGYFI